MASVQEEETTSTLPLLCVPERVLFPGETLPMHIHNPHVRNTDIEILFIPIYKFCFFSTSNYECFCPFTALLEIDMC